VSKKTLQFVPCSGGKEGRQLVNHPKVAAVILTGGTETALTMLRDNPRLNLFAETGGKDATIVTAVSDRDQAIKHILQSAFGHAGQKCSATSLLLLQNEIYDDAEFRRSLCEAAASMKVGSAWELETKIGPLIRPPSGDLETALKILEPDEEWALQPKQLGGNPNLWTPGIKYGVRPGSFAHMTEFFGPVLAVMRFENLREAVALTNQTGFGLTSGLESLDEREWDFWKQNIRAGNLYINRVTTGAIVLRQPFGGMGKSVFGAGMKAGGPNYVAQFMDFADAPIGKNSEKPATPELAALCDALRTKQIPDAEKIIAAMASCEAAQREEFGAEHDHFKLVGQDNVRRYLPFENVRVRVHADDNAFEIFTRVIAAHIAGCHVIVSAPKIFPAISSLEELGKFWKDAVEFIQETDEQLAEIIRGRQIGRVRYAAPDRVPLSVLQAGNEAGGCVVSTPVSVEGRLEMLWYLREQSISTDYHRYGNLGNRAQEKRADVP
jgi:RHH-type transcriptional regulator, proline utilization regulon repressor / proline dehydrogenase / delta 1-pyrroline-5-carboxylate dehydrogenase